MNFEYTCEKGQNKDRFIKIKWQDDFETDSRFVYYGQGTRNEYRIARFGRGFPFQNDENVGDLLVLSRMCDDEYSAFVISNDEEIEDFLAAFGISASETNTIITKDSAIDLEQQLLLLFNEFISTLSEDFPSTISIASKAREIYLIVNSIRSLDSSINPDSHIVNWIDVEFKLFKCIENSKYGDLIKTPFGSVEELVKTANSILNRRKSRAGRSLEHHLAAIFDTFNLSYSAQARTEDRKKPDFIFPGEQEYHQTDYAISNLVFLGAKTTCKDRWRQILNEADRIPTKHLFTLQQGISSNQLEEMYNHNVVLVIPQAYKNCFPREYHDRILNLNSFIRHVQNLQN